MGLHTGGGQIGSGIGNTVGPQTLGISGKSANDIDIYNYNKITLHYSLGAAGATTANSTMVLTNNGCVYNGQPQWDFADGVYDGDYDIAVHQGGLILTKHESDRFGSSTCDGKSHKLRYGGGPGEQGKWEFVTHGYITSYTTANTLNFFAIQGSGTTDGIVSKAPSIVPGAAGRWVNMTGTTDNFPYGRFRRNAVTSNVGGVTGITTDGIIR